MYDWGNPEICWYFVKRRHLYKYLDSWVCLLKAGREYGVMLDRTGPNEPDQTDGFNGVLITVGLGLIGHYVMIWKRREMRFYSLNRRNTLRSIRSKRWLEYGVVNGLNELRLN